MTGTRPVGTTVPQTARVKLICLRMGVERLHSFMQKCSLASLSNYKCCAAEQTANHDFIACPMHQAPHEERGLTVLNDET